MIAGLRSLGNETAVLNSWAGDGLYWVTKDPEVTNYYFVTYASIFGDDPNAAVNTLAKQVKAGTGGFITGSANDYLEGVHIPESFDGGLGPWDSVDIYDPFGVDVYNTNAGSSGIGFSYDVENPTPGLWAVRFWGSSAGDTYSLRVYGHVPVYFDALPVAISGQFVTQGDIPLYRVPATNEPTAAMASAAPPRPFCVMA